MFHLKPKNDFIFLFLVVQFVLRRAANNSGLWENPPTMAKIGGKKMERFLNQASDLLIYSCYQGNPVSATYAKSRILGGLCTKLHNYDFLQARGAFSQATNFTILFYVMGSDRGIMTLCRGKIPLCFCVTPIQIPA